MNNEREIVDILDTIEGILRDAISEQGFTPRLNRLSDRITELKRRLDRQGGSLYDLSAKPPRKR